MHPSVHCHAESNSLDMETAQISNVSWINQEVVAFMQNEIPHSSKKRWLILCYKNATRGFKQNKSEEEEKNTNWSHLLEANSEMKQWDKQYQMTANSQSWIEK